MHSPGMRQILAETAPNPCPGRQKQNISCPVKDRKVAFRLYERDW